MNAQNLPRIVGIERLTPPAWCRSGHAQTITGHLLPSPKLSTFGNQLLIPLQDGEHLVGFVHHPTNTRHEKVMVILMHGLGGDVTSDYMRRSALISWRLGFSTILVNHRGAHEGFGHAVRPYHSGRGEDLSDVVEHLKARYPDHRTIAVGFSLSGSVVLNLASGQKGQCKPHYAISVNAPLDLLDSSLRLGKGFNKIYDVRFVRSLVANLALKKSNGQISDSYRIPWNSSLYDFDRLYTAPAAGFSSREEYYQLASTKNVLDQIDIPTTILSSKDDPFINYETYLNAPMSRYCQLHIEEVGGHMGYYSNMARPLVGHRWLDYFLETTLRSHLKI